MEIIVAMSPQVVKIEISYEKWDLEGAREMGFQNFFKCVSLTEKDRELTEKGKQIRLKKILPAEILNYKAGAWSFLNFLRLLTVGDHMGGGLAFWDFVSELGF
ncbi:hypothetical protein SLA2020_140810 [Shorea laevis]